MPRRASFSVAAAGAMLFATGCAIESPLSVHRFWADWNTYAAPAIVYDRITHQPMRSYRVNELRWMYNLGPHAVESESLMPRHATPDQKPLPEQPFNATPPQPGPGPLVPPLPSAGERSPADDANSPVAEGSRTTVPRTADSDRWRFAQ